MPHTNITPSKMMKNIIHDALIEGILYSNRGNTVFFILPVFLNQLPLSLILLHQMLNNILHVMAVFLKIIPNFWLVHVMEVIVGVLYFNTLIT